MYSYLGNSCNSNSIAITDNRKFIPQNSDIYYRKCEQVKKMETESKDGENVENSASVKTTCCGNAKSK